MEKRGGRRKKFWSMEEEGLITLGKERRKMREIWEHGIERVKFS